jgi:D-alanyl-lipoteichoic acid acyltransferase DltB (MBOAT superfamily)
MLFNSLEFYIFFPVVTLIYFLLPHKFRWLHLLIASCIFYCAFIPIYILVLFFTIVIDYFAGILLENNTGRKRRWYLIASLVSNIGVLAFFKYYNFFIENINSFFHFSHLSDRSFPILAIILPIGLSFHTFQAMSYTIEVYRGNQRAERHFGYYALYVMFYPQLVAGPIERPQHILPQLHTIHNPDPSLIGSGLRLMAWGYFKKMVVADHLALYVDKVFDSPGSYSGFPSATAVLFFSFQIYCDFSGYTDIARGAARVMGISLMRNFNFPYFSSSIREFWTRWHISLSTWFRDYLYFPLGGNRTSLSRWCFNIMVVFLLSGLWHGANWTFIAWGALHGFYLIAGNFANRWVSKPKIPYSRFIKLSGVFLLVSLGWIFFRAKNLTLALDMIRSCFKGYHLFHPGLTSGIINSMNFYICVLGVLALVSIEATAFRKNFYQIFQSWDSRLRLACYTILCLSIICLGIFNNTRFIYFQF